jgi:integrase
MSDEIRVSVVSYGEHRALSMVYICPTSGKKVVRSTGTRDEAAAIGKAAVWQDELNRGAYQRPSKLTWQEFRRRYETEKGATLARRTQDATRGALDALETIVNPDRLAKLTPATMSRFQAKLRERGIRDTTIAKILRHVRAVLSWGVSMGMLAKVPAIHTPKRAKGQTIMHGRPIVEEEFERVLAAVPKVRPHDADQWLRLLTGLWWSGLRLGEALGLSWDLEAGFAVDLDGRRPCFRIRAEAQKSGRDEVLPMTPDFATFLMATPPAERTGRVFLLVRQDTMELRNPVNVGAIVSSFGKRAGVVVNKAEGKFASAHDFRRSFGTRWAKRVKPLVLKRLMRHASITTTERYYVDMDADEVADELWANYGPAGNNSGNIAPDSASGYGRENDRKPLQGREI